MILIIDNYDSFSYNLYQLIGTLNPDIRVIRNDAATVEEVDGMRPEAIVISPGPGRPEDAGICVDLVRRLGSKYPILGVCLGHQAICEAYGAKIVHARRLMHGKTSVIDVDGSDPLFEGLPQKMPVARYHSLAADPATMPDCLKVTARADDGEIMAVRHREDPVCGVQFHPESIMTPDGLAMLRNFLESAGALKGAKR
jgi:anthranilate synthase component 2